MFKQNIVVNIELRVFTLSPLLISHQYHILSKTLMSDLRVNKLLNKRAYTTYSVRVYLR